MALRMGAGRMLHALNTSASSSASVAVASEAQLMNTARASSGLLGRLLMQRATFASKTKASGAAAGSEATADNKDTEAGSGDEQAPAEDAPDVVQLTKAEHEELLKNLELYKTNMAYARADFLNLQQRTKAEKERAEKFALQKFAKALLDVADNMERACTSVPSAAIEDPDSIDKDKAVALLKGLQQGVDITQKVLQKVLKDFGVARFDPAGERFDPNMHDAQYEVPDPSKDAGTVAVVEKCGYMLHDRVLRPAQVGVTRKP